MMRDAPDVTNVVEACNVDDRLENLERMLSLLEMCEKALQDYLETKRIAFPRFYFVAPADLLDILSKGTNPQQILRHLSKCFDNIHNLSFEPDEMGNPSKNAISMWSGEKENVAFAGKCMCEGPVEQWLNVVVETMRAALFHEFKLSVPKYDQMPRTKWMFEQSAQNTITVSRLIFTQEVNEAFDRLEDGDDNAMKDLLQKQLDQLKGIIEAVNGKLEKLDRKKVLTLCTIDVHARDTCQKLIDEKVDVADAFQWSSQLRYGTNEKTGKLQINVCDAEIPYMYEYIGSPGCLVITPLTDRCVITLTQAQRLVLGGASMGAASAIHAAVRVARERERAGSSPETIAGLVLVIFPTFHETRRRRRSQILAAAERGFGAFLKSKKPRPIFAGTDREDEPPRLVGVREDSFEHVMAASADSDLPPSDVIANALRDVPILALCWDCGDKTHPPSSAAAIETRLAPHADVRVAKTLEETRGWSEAVRAFVSGLGAGE